MQIERGGSPRPIDDFITDSPDGLNWVKIGDAPAQGNYITKTAEKIKPEGLSKTREVHPGDLILSNSMSFGKPYIMGIDGCIHDGWLLIRNTYKVFDLTFLCHLLGTPQMIIQYKSLAAGSTVNNLNKELVGNTVVTIPTIKEQRVLGQYLETLDNLITLHQREFAFLCKEKSKKFRYIKNAWEQRKLGELALFNPKDELPQTFEYVDLESVVGTEMLSHRTEVKSSAPSRAQRLAHTGDLFYQTVRPYQKNNYLFEKPDNNYVFSTGYAQMRPYVDGYFLLSLVQSERFVKVVLDNCTGTSYPAINANDLAEIEVAAPSDESEAQKIGTIFRSIDNLITLHQRKYDKLTNVKKSMLEKMFPQNGSNAPEIRFKGFTEAWEQRKFGEVFDCTVPNNTLSRAELSYDEGTVLNVHYGDVLIKYGSVLDVQKDDIPRIPHRCREDFNGALLQDGDVIIADTAEDETTGKACEIGNLQGSAIVSGLHTMVCRPRNRMALGYLGYYLNSNAYHCQLLPLMQGIKVLSLSRSNIQKTSVSYPSAMKEQQLIASYFSQLDHLITLHQRELEKLKNLKKACLEKMFV